MTPFETGMNDRLIGTQLEQNPFAPQSEAWTQWRRGWLVSSTSGRLPALKKPRRVGEVTPVSTPVLE